MHISNKHNIVYIIDKIDQTIKILLIFPYDVLNKVNYVSTKMKQKHSLKFVLENNSEPNIALKIILILYAIQA